MDQLIANRLRAAELLASGCFAEGFALFESWRESQAYAATARRQSLPLKRWRGEPLQGRRFLIVSEEGYGDQIMYARFAKLLKLKGAEIVWLCPPALERLLNDCLGVRAIAATGGQELGGFDLYSPSSSLASLFFPPLQAPPPEPYLSRPPAIRTQAKIGICIRGNPKHPNDSRRSLPEDAANLLLSLPCTLDLAPENTGARDFYDTASIISGLALVISVDTAVAHLAGALGVPSIILLPNRGTDWRWQKGGTESAWYRTIRLVRQQTDETWLSVSRRVAAML